MKEIICRIERCLACKSCEIACAVVHSESGELIAAVQEYPLPMHRVQVLKVDDKGGGIRCRSVALQCRQCLEPACVDACIAGGIMKDEVTGIVRFDRDRCVGCWSCTMVCPFGAVIRVRDIGFAVKCDRCESRDQPACVAACPAGALVFCEPEEFEAELANHGLTIIKESR